MRAQSVDEGPSSFGAWCLDRLDDWGDMTWGYAFGWLMAVIVGPLLLVAAVVLCVELGLTVL